MRRVIEKAIGFIGVACMSAALYSCDLWGVYCDTHEIYEAKNATTEPYIIEFKEVLFIDDEVASLNKSDKISYTNREQLYRIDRMQATPDLNRTNRDDDDFAQHFYVKCYAYSVPADTANIIYTSVFSNRNLSDRHGYCDTSVSLIDDLISIRLYYLPDTLSTDLMPIYKSTGKQLYLNDIGRLMYSRQLTITDSLVATMEKDTSMPARFADWYATH